jgi:hypothetical protein
VLRLIAVERGDGSAGSFELQLKQNPAGIRRRLREIVRLVYASAQSALGARDKNALSMGGLTAGYIRLDTAFDNHGETP